MQTVAGIDFAVAVSVVVEPDFPALDADVAVIVVVGVGELGPGDGAELFIDEVDVGVGPGRNRGAHNGSRDRLPAVAGAARREELVLGARALLHDEDVRVGHGGDHRRGGTAARSPARCFAR